jgi:hypothetical protein
MIRGIAQVWGKRIREESFGLHFNEADEGTAEIRTLSAGAVDDQPDTDGLSAPLPHDNDVLPDSLAARHDIFRHDKLLATRNCKGAAQDQAAGLFIGNICRSPNERPTSLAEIDSDERRRDHAIAFEVSQFVRELRADPRRDVRVLEEERALEKLPAVQTGPEHKVPFQQSAGLAEHRQRIVVDPTKRRFSQKPPDPT